MMRIGWRVGRGERWHAAACAAAIVVVLPLVGCGGEEGSGELPPLPPPVPAVASSLAVQERAAAATAAASKWAGVGFSSPAVLAEQFAAHGAGFGDVDADRYLALARALRDAPLGTGVVELAHADGSTSRFDRKSGAFVAFAADGTIRTFFRPNEGEVYFQRQARQARMR